MTVDLRFSLVFAHHLDSVVLVALDPVVVAVVASSPEEDIHFEEVVTMGAVEDMIVTEEIGVVGEIEAEVTGETTEDPPGTMVVAIKAIHVICIARS